MNIRILVTGANGFIGRHLIKYLKETQKEAELFLMAREDLVGAPSNYIEKIRPSLIFHLAGITQAQSLSEYIEVNCLLGLKLLDALKKHGLQEQCKTVLFGSAAEYGFVCDNDLPIKESQPPMPLNYYGVSKLAQTQMALLETNTMVVRPFTLIGPGMPTHLAMGSFCQQLKEKKGILETGNLNTSRDFLDLRDAVKIIWMLSQNPKAYGQIINLCSGKSVKIQEMVNYLIELSQYDVQLIQKSKRIRAFDMPINFGDNSKLLSLVKFPDFLPWQDSLKQMMSESNK